MKFINFIITSGNEIDSFLDNYRLIRFDFSNGYEEVLCLNWEAAERFNVSNSGFQRIRIERRLDASWNGSQCDVYGIQNGSINMDTDIMRILAAHFT